MQYFVRVPPWEADVLHTLLPQIKGELELHCCADRGTLTRTIFLLLLRLKKFSFLCRRGGTAVVNPSNPFRVTTEIASLFRDFRKNLVAVPPLRKTFEMGHFPHTTFINGKC